MWWLPGIFREVELLERPPAGFDDVVVRADYDHVNVAGTLRVEATAPGLVDVPESRDPRPAHRIRSHRPRRALVGRGASPLCGHAAVGR